MKKLLLITTILSPAIHATGQKKVTFAQTVEIGTFTPHHLEKLEGGQEWYSPEDAEKSREELFKEEEEYRKSRSGLNNTSLHHVNNMHIIDMPESTLKKNHTLAKENACCFKTLACYPFTMLALFTACHLAQPSDRNK